MITGKLHDKYAQTLEETTRYTVYLMELGRRLMLPSVETVTVIFDMADAPMASLDLGSMQFMIQCFQNYYPESLGKCLIVNPPWIFSGFYRMVRPLLDPVVAAKVEIVTPGPDMYKYVSPENLLEAFGGISTYKYQYVPPNGEDDRIKPLDPLEITALEEEVEDVQTKFIDTTIAINGLLSNEAMGVEEDDQTLAALQEIRDVFKKEMTAKWAAIDAHYVPKSLYHRIGVVSAENGSINWPTDY